MEKNIETGHETLGINRVLSLASGEAYQERSPALDQSNTPPINPLVPGAPVDHGHRMYDDLVQQP